MRASTVWLLAAVVLTLEAVGSLGLQVSPLLVQERLRVGADLRPLTPEENLESPAEYGEITNSESYAEEPSPVPTTGVPPTSQPEEFRRVEVAGLGVARGTVLKTLLGRNMYSFMSIPYAMPPVGSERRFKNPEPWEGLWPPDIEGDYDASYLRARCPQSSLILDVIAGREDCLHVSIYTPMLPEDMEEDSKGLPVMFFIHGGAYISGDANFYVPTKLLDKDVVVVVVQYRLATLGFLAGGIPDAPGNMGLMDQVMALRWVQKYISYFGGDPDLVTVFGQSAGGASASWMHLTPLTNGGQSGWGAATWPLIPPPSTQQLAQHTSTAIKIN